MPFSGKDLQKMIVPLFLEQLLMFGTVLSLLIGVLVLVGNREMLRLLFGKVEDSVMDACVTYLKISAYSYPALAVYNSGAAVYRSLTSLFCLILSMWQAM